MSRRRSVARTVTTMATASVLSVAMCAGSAAPAQAGLIGDLLGTVGTVTGTVTTLLTTTTQSLLGPTGWITDPGVTDLDHVAAVIGADRMYSRGVTGKGVGVALIDSGVTAVKGLNGQRHLRPGPLLRVPGPGHPPPRHLRPRHPHGRDHRRRRPGVGQDSTRRRSSSASPPTPTCSASRSPTATAPSTSPRSSPASTGSSPTATTTRPQHPGPQPLLRHRQHPALPHRPPRPRRRERLAGRHRRGRRRRQRRHTPRG